MTTQVVMTEAEVRAFSSLLSRESANGWPHTKSRPTRPNLVSRAAFILVAVIATITFWQRDRSRSAEHLSPRDRFIRN